MKKILIVIALGFILMLISGVIFISYKSHQSDQVREKIGGITEGFGQEESNQEK